MKKKEQNGSSRVPILYHSKTLAHFCKSLTSKELSNTFCTLFYSFLDRSSTEAKDDSKDKAKTFSSGKYFVTL